jgi:iron complex transport system ATP-binding protein
MKRRASLGATNMIAANARFVWAKLGNRSVLSDISIDFRRARWTSVVGLNGAGKSSLLRVLAGLLPHQGDVEILGRPLSAMTHSARARSISWLGQSGTALADSAADDMTVYDLAMLGRLPHMGWLAAPDGEDRAAVERALRRTHAWDWRGRAFGTLSGGERQRVLLARALAVEADVLLMDEPLANLDPPHQADWLQLVRELVASGKTVISVLHEISIALQADELVIIDAGRLLHHGACDDAQTHRALESAFGNRIQVRELAGQWLAVPATAFPG